jgi:hypothetical protein
MKQVITDGSPSKLDNEYTRLTTMIGGPQKEDNS